MAREVLTSKDIKQFNEAGRVSRVPADSTIPTAKDQYLDRLLKYIPAEIVALYVFVLGIMQKLAGTGEAKVIHWIVFVVFCIFTWIYLCRILKVSKIQQLIISVVAFIIWVFPLGGPFALYNWYNPVYGQILLPIFTFGIALWEAEK
jgi:hypothetical protein